MRKLYVVLAVVAVAIGLAVSGFFAFAGRSSDRPAPQGPVKATAVHSKPGGTTQKPPCSQQPSVAATPCPSR